MAAKLIETKIKEALSYGVLLPIALALLIFAPNRIAHTAAERTTIMHHVQYATSSLRPEIHAEECAFQTSSLVSPTDEIDSVVLVILDTVRADVLTKHIDGNPVAPNLQKLAEKSVNFSMAYTAIPELLDL